MLIGLWGRFEDAKWLTRNHSGAFSGKPLIQR